MLETWRLAVAGLLVCVAAGTVPAGGKEPLKDVPEAVKNAARGAVPGIVLQEAELERENGRRIYEVEGTFEGKRYEIEVTEGGEVVEVELEDDEEIPIAELPAEVREAARKALPEGAELVEAEIVSGPRGVAYEVEATVGEKEFEVLVDANGKVVEVGEETEKGGDD